MFLLYFIAYLSVLTYAPTNKVDDYISISHFCISLITPMGSLTRALFTSLNVFSILCRGHTIASYPGQITLYGGPILYLILQSAFLFLFLLWHDSASLLDRLRRKTHKSPDTESSTPLDPSIVQEIHRVTTNTTDGLRALHLTKTFGTTTAVQDITFGVPRSSVFALLGPNGAGKSTTISMIRGDIKPSLTSGGGDVFVENHPISKSRATARNSLGVCPQVDACDQMTVTEHLTFYARVRGVERVAQNVEEGLRAVGLAPFANRMAAQLSGGNKRKLSLAIALMGNPAVLLLDEPSSGMDVCAKRIMWRTLASIVPGRSLVLTTHSMEEADALADRAGIMGGKMLALGTCEGLRKQWGDRWYVHLITKTAPHASASEMESIKNWVRKNLPGAEVEEKTFHGQLRFSVPASTPKLPAEGSTGKEIEFIPRPERSEGIGALFMLLESKKEELGFEYFSLSQTTLDQVFLAIVGKHNIEEENYGTTDRRRGKGGFLKGFGGWLVNII